MSELVLMQSEFDCPKNSKVLNLTVGVNYCSKVWDYKCVLFILFKSHMLTKAAFI